MRWLCMAVCLTSTAAYGSFISTSSDGIDSRNPIVNIFGTVTPLTGNGVVTGQVEPGRPGKSTMPPGDSAANSNTTAIPTAVFVQNVPATDNDAFIDGHAQSVAGVMISSDTTDPNMDMDAPTGVAINADLYSSADNGTAPDFDPESAISAQHIATFNNTRAINMSFANPLVGARPFRPLATLVNGFAQIPCGELSIAL